jgi:hypothetical protein
MSYTSFCDFEHSLNSNEKLLYEFLVALLDQLFGQHDHMRINMETETDHNHGVIFLQWKLIQKYYNVPSTAKKSIKLVRQTLKHITAYLNDKYHFEQPIQFIQKRSAYRLKNKVITPTYIEFSLK